MNADQTRTAFHEASHAAMAIFLGRPVAYTWRTSGHGWPGETLGHARCPVGERVEASQLPIALCGRMATGEADWPPTFEQAKTEPLEALASVLHLLRLSEDQYDRLVALTARILARPAFKELQSAIARALGTVPRLEAEDIEAIARAHGFPVAREES
jgi:hypothetical protein